MKTPIRFFLAIVAQAAILFVAAAPYLSAQDAPAAQVVPVDWSRFANGSNANSCSTPACIRIGQVLLNANKFALNTWWADHKFDSPAADGYLEFDGVSEQNIRPVSSEAQALAVSLRLGLYDSKVTGVPRAEAEKKAVLLVRSLVHRHRANSTAGWGTEWQSPYWASQTAKAGWLLWDQLSANTRRELVKMTEVEAAWVMSNKDHPEIKTYRDRAGKIISPGDTGAEENAWDADALYAALSLMPHAPNPSVWMNKAITLELTAQARPSDVDRTIVYSGKPLSAWLPGSNINQDGTVINHNIVHPDYMVAGLFESTPITWLSLAHQPVPLSGLFNNDVIYNALASLRFTPGEIINGKPVQPPGGTMFIPNSADVYFPQGNDWGTLHPLNFAIADAGTALFSHNVELKRQAVVWEQKHVEFTLQQQARFNDGRTFAGREEFNYPSREEWIADIASGIYTLHWLAEHHAVTFTNQKY